MYPFCVGSDYIYLQSSYSCSNLFIAMQTMSYVMSLIFLYTARLLAETFPSESMIEKYSIYLTGPVMLFNSTPLMMNMLRSISFGSYRRNIQQS